MRKKLSILFLLVFCGVSIGYARQADSSKPADDKFLGSWAGTWQGDGSGKFEMTIAKDQAGKLSGKITAMPDEGGAYPASFKSIVVDANKITIKYDSPESDELEVAIEGTLDASGMKGNWSARQKADNSQVAGGTWTASKK